MAFISSAKHSRGNEDVTTASVSTGSTNIPTASTNTFKKEKEGLDGKLAGFQIAFKDLDSLLESQRLDKNKEGLGYSVVPPPPAQLYSSPKKDLSWTGLPEFKDDTEASPSTISPKSFIKFVKANNSPTKSKIDKDNKTKKSPVKYAEQYRKPTQKPNLRGNQRNWNNLKSYQLECLVLGRNFKLSDDDNVLLRTPRKHNMYSIDLNNIVLHKDLTCLVAKASTDECMLWHMRLGHLNFKTMNKLVRQCLVRGLPTNCFENDHTCTACLKEKQYKASCKSKLVNSISKPLHTLHMDLFGPTSVCSIIHKWYCLVVTDDFSRFTWNFFLKTKDETSSILRKFITEIEKLNDLKVKIIRCDHKGQFRNKEMNDFCSQKRIKREFSNARTPQQNGVAERRNRTLIEAARTMVLVNKSQNKTPYELFNGRTPGGEGYFTGYSMSSKAFKVFNKKTRKVEENLHVEFLENKATEKGAGLNWLFDIDSLTKYMNYVPVDAGTNSTNHSGTKDAASQEVKKDVSSLRYIALPNWFHDALLESSSSKPQDDCSTGVPESSGNSNLTATSTNPPTAQLEILIVETPIPTVSSPVLTACFNDSLEPSSHARLITKRVSNQVEIPSLANILTLANWFEDILGATTNLDESNGVEPD
nr:hypothetical protein [Tanacetum cinerariifolium]